MEAGRGLHRQALPSLFDHLTAMMAAHRDEVDDLNVFPVPDGDTGTNLLLTVRSARDALDAVGPDEDVAAVARRALLRGARGNSGVIVSQVLTALVVSLEDGPLDVPGLPGFLRDARDRAYDAVGDPVQGTILTALDVAVDAADDLPPDLVQATTLVGEHLDEAVVATEQQLEANRRAGVVDAGARGLALLWWALVGLLRGDEPVPAAHAAELDQDDGGSDAAGSGGQDAGPAYEVMYIVELEDSGLREAAVTTLRDRFAGIGDSVVVVGDEDLVQAHVHTDDVGAAIEAGEDLGFTSDVRVTRFADQAAACAEEDDQGPPAAEVGFVAVVPGPGLASVVADLGATAVHGAAGDLPNVAVLLEGVGRTRAERVVILPGHPNVVPTARQTAAVSRAEGGRPIEVVAEAVSVPAVMATLLSVVGADVDMDELAEAADSVRAGEVVPAVRDADTVVGPVSRGQWVALLDQEIVAVGDGPGEALRELVMAADVRGGALVTLVHGPGAEDVDDTVTAIGAVLGTDVEVEVIDGGQRPAAWIVGIE